jgi:hypothetical protein
VKVLYVQIIKDRVASLSVTREGTAKRSQLTFPKPIELVCSLEVRKTTREIYF